MKKLIYIGLLLVGMPLIARAQTYTDIAAVSHASGNEAIRSTASTTTESRTHYLFTIYGSIPNPKVSFEEEHFLGGELTAKWNAFNQNYTHVYSVSIGPSTSNTEIVKPAVYNAVNKVNAYYKKAVKKGLVSKEEAIRKLNHIFDCANVICFDDQSEPFEHAVSKANSPEDIISLFDCVDIKVI
ncbi:hypothetical protein [Paludibacter jiangxiensis]|uniref:Uncharacterized protein n=1 Tax=Paludibacter jiangxiensis TaxID=681398 RepID=A0A170ZW02_9BACT|nr:hypothetical protein [Paludibacter jiangxiensis]GAT63062.1 hypothetical protein PJIAN_3374 [Paludibacter jiangxiensis]